MKILNTTTGKVEELTIIDVKTGCEWTNDLLGNNGALNYNEELEMAQMAQEDIDWWKSLIEKMEANDEKIQIIEAGINEQTTIDDYQEVLDSFRSGLYDCYGNDLDTDADRAEQYLKEYAEENQISI